MSFSVGVCQESLVEEDTALQQEDSEKIKETLQQALLPYVATSKLDIKLCGNDQICRDLAEEYINTYFLVKKQCLRVLESDRLLCQQFKGDCSAVAPELKDICEVFMNVDIEKAKEIGLDKEWQYAEDLIVDIALAQGYLENNIETCSNIIQKYIKKTQTQYYACDIVFSNNPKQKVQDIIDGRESLMSINDEEGSQETQIEEDEEAVESIISEQMPEMIEIEAQQELMSNNSDE